MPHNQFPSTQRRKAWGRITILFALIALALTALDGRKACLLGNHGMIALGRDLTDALAVAVEVESLCEQYWSALQIGVPNILSDAQMQEVIEKFKSYGRSGRA